MLWLLLSIGLICTCVIVLRKSVIYQAYMTFSAVYLFLCPSIVFALAPSAHLQFLNSLADPAFSYHYFVFLLFFWLPMFAVLALSHRTLVPPTIRSSMEFWIVPAKFLPILLIIAIALFWVITLQYGLFFRRLGHAELAAQTSSVPTVFYFFYRAMVETSFFISIFFLLILSLRHKIHPQSRIFTYRLAFMIHFGTFLIYFLLNSRMQFALLLVCALVARYVGTGKPLKLGKIWIYAVGFVGLIIFLTVMREIFEDNARLDFASGWATLSTALVLIANRLNSLFILSQLPNPEDFFFNFDLEGIVYPFKLLALKIFDPEAFYVIRTDLMTSPNVFLIEKYARLGMVDFPKSHVLEIYLGFGALGLTTIGILLGLFLHWLQRTIFNPRKFLKRTFFFSLFVLPFLLQLEKEITGIPISLFKWSFVLIGIYIFRPRLFVQNATASDAPPQDTEKTT